MNLVTTTRDLAAACKRLAEPDYVAVDTEFMRESTYWPILCLIQMAPPDGEPVIVDALTEGLDLAPFFELMGDAGVTKVFHAARQDVEIVYHRAALIPHPLFDTQVAAAVCGYGESVGYEALVKRLAGAQIDKTHRFTDWSRRPLSEAQLSYAAADVTHLRPVYEALAAEVTRRGRGDWIAEEMAILTSPDTYRADPEHAWKRLRLKVRKPRQLAVLQTLAAWREREAQRRDVPRGRILKDDALNEIALHTPADAAALGRLRGVPGGYERSSAGRDIVKLVRTVKDMPESELPALPRDDGPQRVSGPVADLLRVLLKQVAEENRVAARLIANSDDLEAIAADDQADVMALKGWRRTLFGDRALALKHGRVSLAVKGESVVAEPREPPPADPVKPKRRRNRRDTG